MTEKPEGGNGHSLDGIVPPLSDEEFAEIEAQLKKRGLPVILYVFTGPDSISASRLILGAKSRQMAATATELDEWARVMLRGELASKVGSGPKAGKSDLWVPGQGQR